jgi:hypothetical protein
LYFIAGALPNGGKDMSKFPSDKSFCSKLGVASKHEILEGKVLDNTALKTKNRAVLSFRRLAKSLKQADCAIGMLDQRLCTRLDPAQATVAMANTTAGVD